MTGGDCDGCENGCSWCYSPEGACENCGNRTDELTFADADDPGIKFCSRKCRNDWAAEVIKSWLQAERYEGIVTHRSTGGGPWKPVGK